MKTLFLTLTVLISITANAKMTVQNAMTQLSGDYKALEGQSQCDDLTIDVSLANKGIEIRTLELPSRFMDPNFATEADKIIYGTKNKGTQAFLTLKDTDYSTGGDGYSGSLLSRYKSKIQYQINENSDELTVTTNFRGWSLLYSSCTESGFFDKYQSSKTCTYKKVN